MSVTLKTEWASVKKEVNGAVSFDLAGGVDGPFLAYKSYLDCLVKLLTLLRRDATTPFPMATTETCGSDGERGGVVPADLVTQRRNFVRLAQQCLDRVNHLADAAAPPNGGGGGGAMAPAAASPQRPKRISDATADDVTFLLPDVPVDLPLGFSSSPSSGASASSTTRPSETPSDHANSRPPTSSSQTTPNPSPTTSTRQNRGETFSHAPPSSQQQNSPLSRPRGPGSLRFVPNVNLVQNQKATLNMAAYRKMLEQKEIAKKTQMRMEQRLKERKQALEEDAMERLVVFLLICIFANPSSLLAFATVKHSKHSHVGLPIPFFSPVTFPLQTVKFSSS